MATKTTKKRAAAKTGPRWGKVLKLAICIAVPLVVGGVSAALTGDAMSKFGQLNQPPLSPPAWLFPVAWSILYVLMGIASYLIMAREPRNKTEAGDRNTALILYCIQLALNFGWSLIFFLAGQYILALIWLLAMWLVIIALIIFARKRSMAAVWCLLPYILWCTFAMYLNFGVALLN